MAAHLTAHPYILPGLFTSFQSSTSLINPEQNPNLFRSILCIIIKDVTDGDADEIVGEYVLGSLTLMIR